MLIWTSFIDGQTWVEGAIAGFVIGILYFGGLWVTVDHLPQSKTPVKILIVSLLLRLSLCLAGFWWVLMRSPLPTAQFTNLLIAFLTLLIVRTGFTIAARYPSSTP